MQSLGCWVRAWASVVALSVLYMKLASVNLSISSKEYKPADVSGNEIIEFAALSEAELLDLLEEMQSGLVQALRNAGSLVPTELAPLIPSKIA